MLKSTEGRFTTRSGVNILTPSGEVIGRMTTGGTASYYLKDHLGSVRAVVNASGTVLETRDYYPYGLEMPGRSFVSGQRTKENFTGHELDDETGLIYAGARFYMPGIGRFTSVDPHAATYPHLAPYVYAANNPLLYVDPDGKDYVLHFNREERRVTVGATFYTDEAGAESARAAVGFWNKQSGTHTFSVEGVEYTVDFSLDVVVGAFEAGPGSNSWDVVADGELDENVLGGLAGGNRISITERGSSDMLVGAHEIGHALGIRHHDGSIMNPSRDGVSSSVTYYNLYDMIQKPVLDRHLP